MLACATSCRGGVGAGHAPTHPHPTPHGHTSPHTHTHTHAHPSHMPTITNELLVAARPQPRMYTVDEAGWQRCMPLGSKTLYWSLQPPTPPHPHLRTCCVCHICASPVQSSPPPPHPAAAPTPNPRHPSHPPAACGARLPAQVRAVRVPAGLVRGGQDGFGPLLPLLVTCGGRRRPARWCRCRFTFDAGWCGAAGGVDEGLCHRCVMHAGPLARESTPSLGHPQ